MQLIVRKERPKDSIDIYLRDDGDGRLEVTVRTDEPIHNFTNYLVAFENGDRRIEKAECIDDDFGFDTDNNGSLNEEN